jgi:hypothetical protein
MIAHGAVAGGPGIQSVISPSAFIAVDFSLPACLAAKFAAGEDRRKPDRRICPASAVLQSLDLSFTAACLNLLCLDDIMNVQTAR